MAYSITEQVTNVVSSVGKNLNRKISEILMLLINHKNAGSLGALAGFAIAIAFTWKFLRSPSRRRQGQRKRRGSSSTSNHGTRADEDGDSEIQSPLLLKDNDAIDESHPPLKLTLAQIVRKKLNGSRKMTCQLLGVLLEESSPEELQNHATVRSSVVEVLTEIAKSCDVYLMERILDDESGERALTALENAGLFKTGGLVKDKVLFCSTENGRSSFVRQLEPDWHVDTNLEIISQLAVGRIVCWWFLVRTNNDPFFLKAGLLCTGPGCNIPKQWWNCGCRVVGLRRSPFAGMLNIGANDKLDLQPFTIKDSSEPLDVFNVLHAALSMVAAAQKASHLFTRRNVPKGLMKNYIEAHLLRSIKTYVCKCTPLCS